ncbi:MAG: TadE/TadG family type IV pilus assembly protein [Chloroflexia bacterium]
MKRVQRSVRLVTRGQAAVEFALAGTVLIALLFGVLEVGRMMFINSEVENAAREGAQLAALNPRLYQQDPGALAVAVKNKMVLTDRSTVTVSGPCFLDNAGGCNGSFCTFCKVQVSVTAKWVSFVSFIPDVPMRASSVKIVEGRVDPGAP